MFPEFITFREVEAMLAENKPDHPEEAVRAVRDRATDAVR
jgi:hypothetical protein